MDSSCAVRFDLAESQSDADRHQFRGFKVARFRQHPGSAGKGSPGGSGARAPVRAILAVLLLAQTSSAALADTIEAALVRAYQNNPQLNAQRAQVRSIDENVPQALAGYRPQAAVSASAGYQYTDGESIALGFGGELHGTQPPRSVGATVTQTLYNGNQTANKVRAAESQVSGAREALRVLEQTVLLSAATTYMDYLRNAAIVEVQRNNTKVLEATLDQTRGRYEYGELTQTISPRARRSSPP